MLGATHAEELARHRHWNFLRRLIGEEILERYGNIAERSDGEGIDALAKSLACPLRMSAAEVKLHVEPLLRDGYIYPAPESGGGQRWSWS